MDKRTWFIVQFTVGLVTALTAGILLFLKVLPFFASEIIGMIGISLIATSNIWTFPSRKKK